VTAYNTQCGAIKFAVLSPSVLSTGYFLQHSTAARAGPLASFLHPFYCHYSTCVEASPALICCRALLHFISLPSQACPTARCEPHYDSAHDGVSYRYRPANIRPLFNTHQYGRCKCCSTTSVDGLHPRLQQQAVQRWRTACPAAGTSPSKRVQANGEGALRRHDISLLTSRRSLHPAVSSSGLQVMGAAAD
jgi:hypothetical protein